MTLFDECLETLGSNTTIQSEDETRKVFKQFVSIFPVTKWGVIDWAMVQDKYKASKIEDIKNIINGRKSITDKNIYILWNEATLPSIRVDLETALHVIDDVTAVSFDTWLYCTNDNYVIEFHHEGRITIGFYKYKI